ncbi:hypothetical protein [Sphingosinicella microcystinivorans]|uniref:hypothetical protein n=1 Tax=Sphingosinicella microcystinivorans TaxID=335406 RepID=UPI0022F3A03A|nr:hypothetical protein [Sphingosinicella microcystinivorans]WBX82684.1 hypothetical protein PE061_12710 [Sphingosinicella microcystinivorans]
MTDERKTDEMELAGGKASRRALLRLGAVAAPAVVTLRPAWAGGGHHGGGGGGGAVTSGTCQIPIERPICKKDGRSFMGGSEYELASDDDMFAMASAEADDASLMSRGGKGGGKKGDGYGGGGHDDGKKCYRPPHKGYYDSSELTLDSSGRSPMSFDNADSYEAFDAHMSYIRDLKSGQPGFTCLASIKMRIG